MKKIQFEDIARILGMSEDEAEISLNLPLLTTNVIEDRAEKFGTLLLEVLKEKGKVVSSLTFEKRVVIYIEGSERIQEMNFLYTDLVGSRDGVVQKMRMKQKEYGGEYLQ